MTIVSNDSVWWPFIRSTQISSYLVVAVSFGLMYDWALTFGREVELVWRQRWSFMTILYLSVRYAGMLYAVISILLYVPTILMTDTGCHIMYVTLDWVSVAINVSLGAIVIARLHAMYQRSRNVLICLIVVFLVVNIASCAIIAILISHISSEELILSGTYQCASGFQSDSNNLLILLALMTWILPASWEVLTLFLAVRIAVKHFRELQQPLTAWNAIEDCFTVLTKTHVVYFTSFAAVSCFIISYLSRTISVDSNLVENQGYIAFIQILTVVVLSVLGPRLILDVRDYHAKLVVDSDAATGMSLIAFQERAHVSTSGSV